MLLPIRLLRLIHRYIVAIAFAISLVSTEASRGQDIKRLSEAEIQRLTDEGDRFADQRMYEPALEKYTEAFMGVVSKIRGQAFSRSVAPSIFNREKLAAEMERLIAKDMTPTELALLDGTLKVFGFVASDEKPAEIYKNLLTEQVAGFYDPDDKRMVLIVEDPPTEEPGWLAKWLGLGETFNKDEQKTTLAHELTHALQDQLYDLNAMQDRIEGDDDMLLAFSALVEGDATLLMFCQMQDEDIAQMDPVAVRATFTVMSFLLPFAGGESYAKAPDAFRDTLMFPYFQGMLFVMSQGVSGGWPAVHAMYQRPPLSTEQILHPNKYIAGDDYDPPQRIAFVGVDTVVPDRWKSLGGSCLGELQTSILLKRTQGGKAAALGWDGDYYEVFQAGESLAVAMASVWDSEQDAEEFATAFARYALERDAAAKPNQDVPSSVQAEDAAPTADDLKKGFVGRTTGQAPYEADSVFAIQLDGTRVWLTYGFDEAVSRAIIKQLRESEITEKTFPKPDNE